MSIHRDRISRITTGTRNKVQSAGKRTNDSGYRVPGAGSCEEDLIIPDMDNKTVK